MSILGRSIARPKTQKSPKVAASRKYPPAVPAVPQLAHICHLPLNPPVTSHKGIAKNLSLCVGEDFYYNQKLGYTYTTTSMLDQGRLEEGAAPRRGIPPVPRAPLNPQPSALALSHPMSHSSPQLSSDAICAKCARSSASGTLRLFFSPSARRLTAPAAASRAPTTAT